MLNKNTPYIGRGPGPEKKYRFLLAFILLILVLSAEANLITAAAKGGTEFPLTVTDQFAREVTLKRMPRRIVSVSPANTEILFALGLGAERRIVGVTNWCDYPPEVRFIEKVGDLYPLNLEKIISLRPDLVVASDINGKEDVDRLTELGVTVATVNPTTLRSSLEAIELLGRLTGKTPQAGKLVKRIQQGITQIERRGKILTANRGKPLKVLVILGGAYEGQPIWTTGPGTFLDELITLTGGENIGHQLNLRWAQMSMEHVLKCNPDVILTESDGEELYRNKLWAFLSAVQKRQVYTVDINVFSRPGPRLLEAMEGLSLLMEKSE
ncbi:MAG TPA: cobalamin-binding protein [Firmicutes bacterium]|nr:cobalamin-binding protein [Bacillota bacterium]